MSPAAAAVTAPPPRTGAPTSGLVIGVPAYYYPGPTWEQTLAAGPAVRYLVVNPADGPGSTVDAAYVATVATVRAAGVEVLGYVPTTWGARPVEDVLRDVQRYRDWYDLSGVFLDEAATSGDALPHYRSLCQAVRDGAANTVVALNPGVTPDEGYAVIADLLLQFEGPWAAYARWSPPAWQADHPPERFWHVVYATPARSMRAAVRHARRSGAGVVYVTDRRLDNPWDRLPTYWQDEVSAVAAQGVEGPVRRPAAGGRGRR